MALLASEHLSSFWLPGLAAILVIMVIFVVRRKGVRLHGMHCPEFKRIVQHAPTPGATQILITGGVGFLGRNIVKLLLQRKDAAYDVHVLDITLPAEGEKNDLVASYIQGDVRNVGHVREALTGMDTVFHTAGVFNHNVNVTDKMMWDVNVKGTENIVKTCQEKSIRKLIFTSTCIVTMGKYDATAEGWDEERPYPREPVNGYVRSKIAAETIVLAANNVTRDGKGLATCVLRPAGLFGIGDKILADLALQGQNNYYIGDGTARFDLVHVDSVAMGHICAAQHLSPVNNQVPIAAGKIYNLTAGKPVMYIEFCGGLCEGPTSFWGHAKPKSIPVWLASALATMNELSYQCLGMIPFSKSFTRLSVEMTQRTYWFSHARATAEIGYNPEATWRDSVNFLVSSFKRDSKGNTRQRRKSSPCLASPHVTSGASALDQRGAT